MDKDLKGEEKELTDDINNLTKKACYSSEGWSLLTHFVVFRVNTWRSSSMMRRLSFVIS